MTLCDWIVLLELAALAVAGVRIWQLGSERDRAIAELDEAYLAGDRVQEIDGFAQFVATDPWEYTETEQTAEDRALRERVLPNLIAACRGGIR